MKVTINHVEKTQGMIFKKTLHGVELSVAFNEEELAIIRERKLEGDIIVERGVPADVDAEKHANRGLASKLATAALSGADANHFHLTIGKLMKGTDTYFFETPLEAKEYDEHLRDTLPNFKNYLLANAEKGEGGSFEL